MLHRIPITLLVFFISKLKIHLLCRIIDYPLHLRIFINILVTEVEIFLTRLSDARED